MCHMLTRILSSVVVVFFVAMHSTHAAEDPVLRVAVFRCDVTPPLGQPIYSSYKPLATVEHPLLAKGIVLDDGMRRYVICAVDWCELCNSTHLMFRRKIAAAAQTDVASVAVQTVHQHTAPMADEGACRLLEQLDDPPPHPDPKVFGEAANRVAAEVKKSLGRLVPFDRVGTGQFKVDRVAASRRVPDGKGGIRVRYSSCRDPALRAEPEGKIDPMLKTITLAKGDKPLVRLHYYATHPQSFYGDPRASYDFPGIARERLEKKEGVFQIYFTGCSGDVTAGKYNDGSPRARTELADRLFAAMEASAAATRWMPADRLQWRRVDLILPMRTDAGYTVDECRARMADPTLSPTTRIYSAAMRLAYAERSERPIALSALQIGNVHVLHLPGEAMVEFQLFAQHQRPQDFVAVAAYGDCGMGYICTERAFGEGGYEPGASLVVPNSETLLKSAIRELLQVDTPPYEVRQGGYVEKVDPNVSYKARLTRIPPKTPAESLESFQIIDGFRIELAAAEPLVRDAVDLAFDESGRMYVAEMIPYAEGNGSKFGSPRGRISRLEDTDGDGRFDRSTIYVDKLVWPTGVTCFDGGIFIAAAPDLLYCKDTNGDGKADQREVVVTGFELSNPNALPNSLRWGLDNRLHVVTSTAGGLLRAVRWQQAEEGRPTGAVQARGRDFSLDPRTGELRLESGGGQFGMTFDVWGRKFESSNSAPIEMVMYEDRYIARNPFLAAPSPRVPIWTHGMTVYPTSPPEPWRVVRTEMRIGGVFSGPVEGGGTASGYFTAACGLMIYKGDAWPEQYRGNALVCEGAGNLVHRMRLAPDGIGVAAHRTEQKREFWTSREIWFRPIQLANAPDGTLYLADMYREMFEHPDAVPPSVKKHLDLTSGNDRGRVYRIVPEGFARPKLPRLGEMSTVELVGLLEHPNGWHRTTASRLLYERRDRWATGPLEKLAAGSNSPLGRMHAMCTLDGLEALSAETVLGRLDDSHPRVREHAVRLAEGVIGESPAVREKLYTMVDDPDASVRYQAAFTLGEIPGSRATEALAAIAARDVRDRWVRLAVLSSSLGRAGELSSRLVADRQWRATPEGRAFLGELAEQVGLQDRADQVADVLHALDGLAEHENGLAQDIVAGLGRGLKKSGSPLLARLSSSGKAGQLLGEMIRNAKLSAVDEDKPVAERVEAVRSLAMAPFEEAADVLAELLDGRQPQAVQVAAIQTSSRFQGSEVAETIVAAWGGFSPKVRGEAAEALFARTERLATLLSAIEDKRIGPSQLDPARIEFLKSHPRREIRERAIELLGTVKLARRAEAVAAYRDVPKIRGDSSRGKEVFQRECSTCHRLEGVGYDLGLPLATVDSRGREGILAQILDPNREVNPTYLNYTLLTDDGLSITGMITAETATSVTLTRAEGESDTALRANIDELQSSGLSVMPEGLELQISKPEMADLIEYLMSIE